MFNLISLLYAIWSCFTLASLYMNYMEGEVLDFKEAARKGFFTPYNGIMKIVHWAAVQLNKLWEWR